MRKLTTQEFIDRARAVHGDKYGYAFSVYSHSHHRVFIYCKKHKSIFSQKPSNHINGNGCPHCSGTKKHNNESFINQARGTHGEKYCYDMVNYINNSTGVIIICHKHGEFTQTPSNHLGGNGCPDCAGVKKYTNQSFIEKARTIHGHKYNYLSSTYLNSQIKTSIMCPEHGEFKQTPSSHLSGQGCPGCANYGFDRTKIGFLYVLRSDCGQYMKIGITNKPDQRYMQLLRATPFSFKRIELIEGTGDKIANLEKELLTEYQSVGFTEVFDGSTEWRLWDNSVLKQFQK